jgi:glutamine amidotransferase
MTRTVTVVDYGSGNVFSVSKAFEHCGAKVTLSSEPEKVAAAELQVLPGVGAFGAAMEALAERGLDYAIKSFVATGRPFLGICVGKQAVMERSEEFGHHDGLGLIPGAVLPVEPTGTDGKPHQVPHMGWNQLVPGDRGWSGSVLAGQEKGISVYFVHSFAAVPASHEHVLATCDYDGREIVAAVMSENVTGCQFHPEKSGPVGLSILTNFIKTA